MRSRLLTDRTRRRLGFTLVEVLLAAVVMLIGLTATLALLGQAACYEVRARHRLVVSTAAQDMLGDMETMPFAQLTTDNARWSPTIIEERCAAEGVPAADATVEIQPYPQSDTQHLKRIHIVVTYGRSYAGIVEYETLIADRVQSM
jgi:prepilin-type N-terminal cleavage/methylation domain-containing protein